MQLTEELCPMISVSDAEKVVKSTDTSTFGGFESTEAIKQIDLQSNFLSEILIF